MASSTATPWPIGESVRVGDVDVGFVPAGHVLGSAQIVLDYRGERVVASGDYKRRADPTCAPFEPVRCDVFITEATFALPVFRHPDTGDEIDKLIAALHANPDRCVLVGAYALGKAQRVIAELRARGMRRRFTFTVRCSGCATCIRSLACGSASCCRRPALPRRTSRDTS